MSRAKLSCVGQSLTGDFGVTFWEWFGYRLLSQLPSMLVDKIARCACQALWTC